MLYQEFKSAGVVFAQALEQRVWGSTNFVVKDVDENLRLFARRRRQICTLRRLHAVDLIGTALEGCGKPAKSGVERGAHQ